MVLLLRDSGMKTAKILDAMETSLAAIREEIRKAFADVESKLVAYFNSTSSPPPQPTESTSLFPLSSATTAAAPLLLKKIDSDSVPPLLTIPIQPTFNHSLMKLETEIHAAFSPSDVGIAVAEPLSPSELSQGIESLPFSDESDNAGCRPTKHYLPGLLHKDTPHLEVDNCFNNKTHSDIQKVVQDSTNWPEVNIFNQQRLNSFADFNYDGHYFAASDFLNMLTAPRCSPSSSFPSSGNIHVLAPTRCLRSVCPVPILRYFHERSGSTWIEEPPGFWFQPPLLIPSHGYNVICSQEREGYSRKDDGCPQLLDLIPEDGVWTYFTPSFFPQDQGQVAVNKESSQTSSNRQKIRYFQKLCIMSRIKKDRKESLMTTYRLLACLPSHVSVAFFYVEKENVRVLLRQDSTFWTSRPVAELRVRVAADDVLFLLHINHEMIKKINGRSLCELLIWKSLIGFLLFDSNCGDKDLSHAAFLKLSLVNGVIFTGGWAKSGLYREVVESIFKEVLRKNDAGDHFPLFPICLGFEHLLRIVSEDNTILERFNAVDQSSTLQFVENIDTNGTLFHRFPPTLLKKLPIECLVMQHHKFGISPEKFMKNKKLCSFFKILTTSADEDGKIYISTVQARRYPVTAVQWHPEKNAFEWGLSGIPHSEDAVQVTQCVANFIVREARMSLNRPLDQDILDNLIYNYTPTYCGKAGRGFDEVYIFSQLMSKT